MKKLVITAAAVAAMVSGAGVAVHVTGSQNDPIFEANVEALANGEGGVSISTCLGVLGPCTLPNGTVSKAPAVEIQL